MRRQQRLRQRRRQRQRRRPTKTAAISRAPSRNYDNTKIAFLIACEYVTTSDRLPGCHNDIKKIYPLLIYKYGYNPKNITVIMDWRNHASPTMRNIKLYMSRVVNTVKRTRNAHLLVYYSGHGTQVADTGNGRDEIDGQDECIVPADYYQAGVLRDDYIYDNLWRQLPSDCTCTAVFDSCNSGSVLDLPSVFDTSKRTWTNNTKRSNNGNNATNATVISLSGCRDDQTSASAYNLERTRLWEGALSFCLRQVIAAAGYRQISLLDLITQVRRQLQTRNFKQVPQLASSKNSIDYNTPWRFF